MEENAYPVENTPERGGSVEASGGGSGEVNDVIINVNGSSGQSVVMKRKRGRPKKLPVEAQSVMMISSSAPQMGFPSPNSFPQPVKRGRGRPKGSGKARFVTPSVSPPPGFREGETFGYGDELKPHILPVYPGEDVHGRILSFAQSGNRAITVMSCTGPVARVSICAPGSTGGMIYEGLFEILTLSGTFTCGGPEGSYHRRGMLTACLAKPNGEVFGGCVSGPIIAAGPIQLILCSFEQGRRPSPSNIQFRSYPAPHFVNPTPMPTYTPTPAPQPPPPVTSQVRITKANDNIQQTGHDQDTLLPSFKSDPLSSNAQVPSAASNPKEDQISAPFLNVPLSPQHALDHPQLETEAQVVAASFENENPTANANANANVPDQ